jgi:heptosyltransferase-2
VTPTAVIQVKQGIGDVIWHLPFIRAIAAASPGGAVTFLTLPSSRARELLQGESCVAETLYFEHKGNELQRGLHLARLARTLRRGRFECVWILDRTIRPAIAAWLAGVPQRIGLGLGPQRLFITNPGIDQRHFHDLPIDWLRALMDATETPFPGTEPNLQLPAPVVAQIAARFAGLPQPWVAIALGASHPSKDWSTERWAELIVPLRQRLTGTLFMIGGPDNAARADAMIARSSGAQAVNACALPLIEASALLACTDLFVGPDSGPMNIAAAVGTPALVMFGSTPVQSYSRFIHPLVPDDGVRNETGMQRISPASVLAELEKRLDALGRHPGQASEASASRDP